MRSIATCKRAAAVLILTWAVAGCDSLLSTDDGLAETARVIVTGTSPVPLVIITSNQYTAVTNQATGNLNVSLLTADSVPVTSLPFDRTYPIGDQYRFYVRFGYPDTARTADIQMRVLLDTKEVYNQRATIRDGWLEYVFVYY